MGNFSAVILRPISDGYSIGFLLLELWTTLRRVNRVGYCCFVYGEKKLMLRVRLLCYSFF